MKYIVTILFLALGISSLSAQNGDTKVDYAGTWKYQVKDTPEGTFVGKIILKVKDNEYVGQIESYGQKSNITNLTIEGNRMSFNTDAEGYFSKIRGTFEADTFNGHVMVEGEKYAITAKKLKEE